MIDLSRPLNVSRIQHLVRGSGMSMCIICKKARSDHRPSGHRFVQKHMLDQAIDIRPGQICHGDMILCTTHGGLYTTLWVIR